VENVGETVENVGKMVESVGKCGKCREDGENVGRLLKL
jgi:hypothetical protein